MYWIIVLGFGYALGTFMAAGWRPYAMCLPVAALIYFLLNFLIIPHRLDTDLPNIVNYIVGSVMYAPIIMLGVFLAQRKAKKDSYD